MSQLRKLLLPTGHQPLANHRRATLIVSRVRVVSLAFAILTPSWILVDYLIYDWPLSGFLAALRVAASGCFLTVALMSKPTVDIRRARGLLIAMMLVPLTFFMISNPIMSKFEINGVAQAVSMGYVFLPFVIMAGLSVFPITAAEGLAFAIPTLLVMFGVSFFQSSFLPFSSYIGALWLLALIAVVSTFAGMSQLHFMCQLVKQSSLDHLTEVYNRGAGIELLKTQFAEAAKRGTPFAVGFLDLDDFKTINDNFGHEEGDNVLRAAAEALRKTMRRSDTLIRWGGEEFLVAMPHTTFDKAMIPLQRLMEKGLGVRPDDRVQTASIGLAEWIGDNCEHWADLVDLADQRMYEAKQDGKNRLAIGNERVLLPGEPFPS